jgi:acylphosphatase
LRALGFEFPPFNPKPENSKLKTFAMADTHHETVFFSGHVQGVGFRYSVLQVAKEFEVAGFVSNLADGRVQLEAEGREADVSAFIAAVQEKMHGYIRKAERSSRKRPAQFSGFTIK